MLNIEGSYNYYTYSWMQEDQEVTSLNWAWLGVFGGIFAVCFFLIACSKMLKFFQFFMAKRQYEKLDFKFSLATPAE